MRLDRLTEIDTERRRRHAAVFAAVYGGGGLLYGLFAAVASGFETGQLFTAGVALASLALALGSWHGSRGCAGALLALFLLERMAFVLATGTLAPLVWVLVGGFLLWGGLRSALARHAATAPTSIAAG
jgi:hypothetical protein